MQDAPEPGKKVRTVLGLKKRQDADFGRKNLGYRKIKSQAARQREQKTGSKFTKIKKAIHSPPPPP